MKNNLPIASMVSTSLNSILNASTKFLIAAFLFLQFFCIPESKAQQPQMSDFVLFSGNSSFNNCTPPPAPGSGVLVGCNSAVNGGSIGTRNLFQTTGNASITGNVYSKEKVDLASGTSISGKLNIANSLASSGSVLIGASNITIGGNIDVNGNTLITSGTVSGKVTRPIGSTYSGPVPAGGEVIASPSLTTFPNLPSISTFAPFSAQADINTTRTISPGAYDDIKLPGWKILTLNGTGTYIFDKVDNSGDNDLVFDFKNNTTGVFKIYIHGDADFGQIKAKIINGGSASRIYTEVHGNGSSFTTGNIAFLISNCSTPPISSWLGTVWAPYGAIKIGSLSGGTNIAGALWSGTQVNVRCGVTITSVPYQVPVSCSTPNVNAGLDKLLTCISPTQQLNGSSSTSGVSYNWVASNGGNIVSGATTATPIVNTVGTYTLTVTTSSGGCTASDVVVVTSLLIPPAVDAGIDKQITCNSSSVQLNGSSITAGVSYSWVASNGGNIVSGAATAQPIVNAAGTYTLTVLESIGGCTSTDIAIVTSNSALPNANAGTDKQITCSALTVQLNGSSTTPGVSYTWITSNGGNLISGTNTATPIANAAGTYTLKVTNTATGCYQTDVALVTLAANLPTANAGSNKQLSCTTTSVQLSGSSTTTGAVYSWVASNGGNIVSGASTATPTVNAAGTYTLSVTSATSGCSVTDAALVTSSSSLPNVNAGTDKQLSCSVTSVQLNGSSSTTGVSYSWSSSNGGNIASGGATATPTVNAAGTYTLTVTETISGCTKTDVALVTSNTTLPNANAGLDKTLSCTVTAVQLNGSSTTGGVSYSWVASNGGNIVSGSSTATPTANAAGTYTLTVTNATNGCTKTDIALVTSNTTLPNANAGLDKTLSCTVTSVQLNGSSTTGGVSYSWVASNGGNIVSGSSTATPTVNAAGTYTLKVTNPANGCTKTDIALVTFNGVIPNANAGADKQLTCLIETVVLNGSSTSTGVSYNWVATNGGSIVSGGNTATPTVNSAGRYTLTVTNTSGCTKTDFALVTKTFSTPNVSAGADVELSCTNKSGYLLGSSTTPNATFLWTASNGGNIVSNAATASPLVDGVGNYTLTVTNPADGCKSTDIAKGTKGCVYLYYPQDSTVVAKTDSVIGSELTSLNKYFKIYNPDTTGNIFRLAHDSVWIEVIALNGSYATLLALLQTTPYGMTNIVTHEVGSLIITGKYPIKNLLKLNLLTSLIDYCRPLYPPILSNSIISQGDTALRSRNARLGFDITGAGIKVGIISDSYNKKSADPAAIDISNGDLPGAGNPDKNNLIVDIVRDLDFKGSDEGRAMAQIVHDVAPKAELAFRTGFIDASDFALGIKELEQNNCDVIVDDVTYITEPFFQDGVIANAVDAVSALGVSYFTSAGNFGGQSYTSTFSPAFAPASIAVGSAHNFGGGDVLQSVFFPSKGNYTIVLQWEDGVYSLGQFTGTQNDLDIYLVDDDGNILVSWNRNNIGRDPIEVLPISVGTASAKANLMITRAVGSVPVKFKYIVFSGQIRMEEYASPDSSTIVGQANSLKAITVGASYYKTTPAYGVSPAQIESFSSVGGSLVSGNNRNKPDIIAPDGGLTSVVFNGQNSFFGTSAAAPHAAGVAALMLQARSKFYTQTFNSDQVKSIFKSTALSMAISPIKGGAGFMQADAAILTFASAKPNLTDIELPNASIIPGIQPFTVTINGEYLTAASKVLLNGVELPTTVINSNEVRADVPTFIGNPPLQVNNPATVPNNNDGGISNKLYFTPLKKVVVKADDVSKKFGEEVPVFTHTITVDGFSLAASGLTLADLGLTNILDSTSVTSTSHAPYAYYIRPYRAGGFDTLNPADSALLSLYEYTFLEGKIKVNKMPLKITARDTTMIYGSKIDGQEFKFSYAYDDSKIAASEKATFLNFLKGEHTTNITDAVAFLDGKLANSFGKVVTNKDLANLSIIASETSIANGRSVINNSLTNASSFFVDIAPETIFKYNENPDSTILISGFVGQNSRGLLSESAVTNSFGKVVTNSFGKVVTNSFGKVVTNSFGKVVTNTYSDDTSNINLAILIDSFDVYNPDGSDKRAEIKVVNGINLITGYTVGLWSIVPGALLYDDFEITYGIGELTITPAPLTLTVDNKSRFYGEATNPVLTYTATGFVNGDGPASFLIPPVLSTTATSTSPAGSYLIKINSGTGTAANYLVTKINGTLTVKKAILTATADNKTRVYGSANPLFTISYSGFVNGEDATALLTQPVASTMATVLSSVGTYPITLTGGTAANYTITKVSGNLDVTKASLLATADNKSKTYGSSNPTFTITYSGFLNGDGPSSISTPPSASSTATKLTFVGSYPIVLSGGNSTNYALQRANGLLDITPAALSVKADNKTISAGASLPSFTYSIIGFVTGGANTISSGPNYSVSPLYSGAIGTYTITPSALVLSQPANYTITYVNGTLLVTTSNSSAKNIKIELECVDTLINDASGFHYQARFEYENDNCYSVTVPIGPDNSLTGNYIGAQPTVFKPGEHHVTIKFDGTLLSWVLKSYKAGVKTTSTASASKNSNRCHCVSSRLAGAVALVDEIENIENRFSAFPNPASDELYLTSDFVFGEKTTVTIIDILGQEQLVNSYIKASDNKIKLNVGHLLKGTYFIKINSNDAQHIIRFMKE